MQVETLSVFIFKTNIESWSNEGFSKSINKVLHILFCKVKMIYV